MILNLKGKGDETVIKDISDTAKIIYNSPKVEARAKGNNFEMRIFFENEFDLYGFQEAVATHPGVNIGKIVTVPFSEN